MKTLIALYVLMVTGLQQPVFSNEAARIEPSTFTATYGDAKHPLQLSWKRDNESRLTAFSITAFGKTHTLTNEQLASVGAIDIFPPEVTVGRRMTVGTSKSGNEWYLMTFKSVRGQAPTYITVEDSVDELKFENPLQPTPNPSPPKLLPKDGFVPDENTAVKVAEAILKPAVGDANAQSHAPYKATLKGDIWMVEGTAKGQGGTPVLEISKQDGKIVRLLPYSVAASGETNSSTPLCDPAHSPAIEIASAKSGDELAALQGLERAFNPQYLRGRFPKVPWAGIGPGL